MAFPAHDKTRVHRKAAGMESGTRNETCLPAVVTFFVLCGGFVCWERYEDTHAGFAWVGICGLFLIIALTLAMAMWLYSQRVRRFGLACQNCGKPLLGGRAVRRGRKDSHRNWQLLFLWSASL